MDTLRSNEQRLPRHSENLIDSAFQSKLNIKANYSDKESSGGDQNKEVPFRVVEISEEEVDIQETDEEIILQEEAVVKIFNKSIAKDVKNGHLGKDCYFKRNSKWLWRKICHIEKGCRLKENQQEKFFEGKENDDNLFYACQSTVKHKNNIWILNSGGNNHMRRWKYFR